MIKHIILKHCIWTCNFNLWFGIFIANYDVYVNSLLTDINYGILLDLADEYQEKKAVNLLHNIGQKRKVKIIRYIMRGIEDNK